METMTLSVLHHQRNKVEAALERARRSHGTPGRGGAPIDAAVLVARLEAQLSDWTRLLEFAQSN